MNHTWLDILKCNRKVSVGHYENVTLALCIDQRLSIASFRLLSLIFDSFTPLTNKRFVHP
jgi:hypothetical protein